MDARKIIGKDRMFDEAISNLWLLKNFSAKEYEQFWKDIAGTAIFYGLRHPDVDDLRALWDNYGRG
jgi:hypothetical protein